MPKISQTADVIPSTRAEKQKLQVLVRGIVLAQGNIFIRELLRKKQITIGTTKADFLKNLLVAIESGGLRLADVQEWLDEVEGWGDQHVYLFKVPLQIASDAIWSSPDRVKERLSRHLQRLWNRQASLEFPETRTLTGIYFGDKTLRYVWQERVGSWLRTPEKDTEQIIDDDRYLFKAYRERLDRTVMRFVMRLDLGLAGIFLKTEWSETGHDLAIADVKASLKQLLDFNALDPVSTSEVIKNLDQLESQNSSTSSIKTQRTRLSDAGNYVEFASTSEAHGFKESTAIRRVWRAVTPDAFRGTNGTFFYSTKTPTGQERIVKIDLFGEQRRIRIRAQLKAAEVWDTLRLIQHAEKAKTRTA